MPIGKRKGGTFVFSPKPAAVSPQVSKIPTTIVKRSDILSESHKMIKTGAELIDNEIEGVEEGTTIIYGEWDTGKTTLCLQLTMNALQEGMNVIYVDTEIAVHKKRLKSIYEGRGYSFPVTRLSNVFIRLHNWSWESLRKLWLNVIQFERPDLFIVDSPTPVFLDRFFTADKKENWFLLQSRDALAIETLKQCADHHIITVIVGHEKTPQSTGTVSELLAKEAVSFSGLGRRFAYLAKTWIYLFKEPEQPKKGKVNRYMALLKHRYNPTFSETGNRIPFRIDSSGIVT